MTFETGPYLTNAAICETVLQEAGGTYSLIRMFDRLTLTAQGTDPEPAQLPPMNAQFTLFVGLKSGSARGKHTLAFRMERPDGLIHDLASLPMLLEGEDHGANNVLNLQMQFEQEGLYWFHLLLDDQHLTRVPLRIIVLYQRIQPGGLPPASS